MRRFVALVRNTCATHSPEVPMLQRFRAIGSGALLLLALSAPCFAQSTAVIDPVGVRGDFSGTWRNPAMPGQGLTIEVIDRGRAVVTWFTFDPAGAPLWLYGLATIDGHVLRVPASRVTGGRFPPAFDPAQIQVSPWGELEIDIVGCNDATLSWTPTAAGYGAGSMPLTRLTGVQGVRCNAEEEFAETRSFSFERGSLGFEALFADRPPGEDAFYELDYQYESLPAPLSARRGVRISGNNHSDDLAMLVKGPIEGLMPNTLYRLELEMEIASNVPAGCFGVGGSPGDGVYMKLGATTDEPMALTSSAPGDNGWLRLNFDYGQQSQSGDAAKVVGTLANSYSCDEGTTAPWELRTLSTRGQSLRAISDPDGVIWVVAGSDSAFEGRTDWYLTALRVRLEFVPEVELP
jgi:hypothetical protein